MIHPQISLFREMELRRRKKEEEKLSTERKIREVQVKILLLPPTYNHYHLVEIYPERGELEEAEGVLAGDGDAFLCWSGDVRGRGLLFL